MMVDILEMWTYNNKTGLLKEGKPWTLAVVAIYRVEVDSVCGDALKSPVFCLIILAPLQTPLLRFGRIFCPTASF